MNETKSANPVSREEWSSIQEQIKLVLEENALLVEQQEAETRKLTARLATKDAEVLALKEKVASTDEEINRLKKRVKEVHGENELLRDHYERVKEDSVRKMSVEEHRVSLEECSKVAAELEVRFRAESLNVRERLDAVNKEKNSLSVHLAGELIFSYTRKYIVAGAQTPRLKSCDLKRKWILLDILKRNR
eukprot:m.85974 g.85974  ORF g.85974 m.85974 type:complete len:190 (+) comp36485_c0_seq21:1640-2209(+)